MKQLEAPKQTATINGLGLISKFVARAIAIGVIIIAMALFDINAENKLAPVLSVYGGKLTTYRKLSEKALNKLKSSFPKITKPWTHKEKL